ncbi:MAG TPA: hypothetical protein VNR89_00815 [Roseomonas sp.]|nr:hypothetical protein [Roseomonas sp.]
MSAYGTDQASARRGRLLARPGPAPEMPPLPPGLHGLGLARRRDGFLRVPEGAGEEPLPLVVMLHGAGGHAAGALRLIEPAAPRVLLLAPESRAATWDVIMGGFGPDVAFIDAALREVFLHHRVDPQRLALAGFSDGASYALSLGLGNGNLFTHLLAFSPGFAAPPPAEGGPDIFISHGVEDDVLPINACSRRVVPRLRQAGYSVEYREFAGGHHVPEDLAAEAVRRVVGG